MKSKLIIALIICGTAFSGVEAQTTTSLAGSWQLTLTAAGPTPTPTSSVIHALATFTSDGSVIETDSSEVAPLSPATTVAVHATPGHGIWQPAPAFGNLFIQFISLQVNSNQSLHARKT